jgi:hypothetical protein
MAGPAAGEGETMIAKLLVAAVLAGVPAAAAAQFSGNARPLDMDPSRSAIPSRMDQIADGTRDASDRRAQQTARRGGDGARAAAVADLVPGAAVSDARGAKIGTIESVATDGAVVAAEAGKVKVPLDAFGKNRGGLLLGLGKAEFDALVAKAQAAPAG